MIKIKQTFPFYIRITIILFCLSLIICILYVTQNILIPLVFAIIIAIVLHPVVNFITRLKINRIFAIIITLGLTFIFFSGIGILIISQINKLSESWPQLADKFTVLLNQMITSSADYIDINPKYFHNWISNSKNELINSSGATIGNALIRVGGWFMILCLIPVYVFVILYYHPLLIEFIHRLFIASNQKKVSDIVFQIKKVIQRYLIGLFLEVIIVSTLNTIALLVLGIEYALLLGIIGGLFNLIPYIGGIVAIGLPMIVALVTLSSPLYALYILILYTIIQIIDNNIIVPIVVASKVRINALFSIIILIAGDALWGISGMFLSFPILAILKVIFDQIEPLKPWGFLMGDTMPVTIKTNNNTHKQQ